MRPALMRWTTGVAALFLTFGAIAFAVLELWPIRDPEPGPAAREVRIDPSIQEVGLIASLPYPGWLVGRQAELTDILVLAVVGDRSFWVGRGKERRAFVVMSQAADRDGPRSAGSGIDEGEHVSLRGIINWMPSEERAGAVFGEAAADAAGQAPVYIAAESVRVADSGPADDDRDLKA